MKKTSIFFKSCIFISAILFTGCFNPIFYNIRQDVAPEEATVTGTISSLVRYNVSGEELLVTSANGGIRYKKADVGNDRSKFTLKVGENKYKVYSSWKALDPDTLPFEFHHFNYYGEGGTYDHEGEAIIKVAADAEALYVLTVTYKKDEYKGTTNPTAFSLYTNQTFAYANDTLTTTKDSWKKIAEEAYDEDTEAYNYFTILYDTFTASWYTDFNLFCSNAPQNAHRVAYLRNGYLIDSSNDKKESMKLYKLNGTSDLEEVSAASIKVLSSGKFLEDDKKVDVDGVAYVGSDLYFFDSYAVTTNETKDKAATKVYYGGSGDRRSKYDHTHRYTRALYSYTAGDAEPAQIMEDAGEPVSCLSYTKDALLIGRADYSLSSSYAGGIAKIKVDADGNAVKNKNDKVELGSFETNAAIQLSTQYLVLTLLAVDPALPETENNIYGSITFKTSGTSTSVSYTNIGLWAYYPERNNWNKE